MPRENLIGELNDGWRITMGSLAHERGGLGGGRGPTRDRRATSSPWPPPARARPDGVRRRLAEAYEQVASLRALGYKGFAGFAQGSSAPEHSYMKLATSELGKALYELGMELLGPYGAVVDPDRGEEAAAGAAVLHQLRRHHRRRHVRDPAQHHRPRVLGLPRA